MANTYITSGSRFRPYTFAEMLQPVQIYTEAYNQVEDELANLDVLAGDVAGKLTNPADKELSDKALTFQTELTSAMNDLYSKGLNPTTRKQLAGLKARYTKELNPINEAYKAYQEDQKQLTNLKRLHPEMIVEGIGASISDYMYGNTPSGLTANTEDIYNKSLKEAAGTSSRFSEILKPTGILGNQYYQFKTQQGISQDMVDKLRNIVDNPYSKEAVEYLNTEEGKALYDIVIEQRRANNYSSFSKEAQDRIDASILNGIFSGVSYKEDVDRVSNKGWKDPNTPPPPADNPSTLNTITLGTKTDKSLVKQAEKDVEFSKSLKQLTNTSGEVITTNNELFMLEKEIKDLRQRWSNAQIDGTSNKDRLKIENSINAKTREYESKKEKFIKELNALNNKYSYLNFGNVGLNVSIGSMYDNARSQEEVFIGDLQYRPEDEKKLDNSVITDLTGLSGGNIGLFNLGETEALSTEKANALLDGSHVVVKSDEGIVLKTSEGVKTIKGIDNVDSFNASYKATSNFLKDYTRDGLETASILQGDIEDANNITPNIAQTLYNEGKATIVSDENGDTFYGIVVKDYSTNDIYKVLVHEGGYKAISSLNEIVSYGGPSIRKYEEMMLNRGLEHYFNINTRKP